MENKKNKILNVALNLFAFEAYDAVSTRKIAEIAEVSEGLIFKHFRSKNELLEAGIKTSEENLKYIFTDIIKEENPKMVLRKTVEIPFNITKTDLPFWRFLLKLKWHQKYNTSELLKPFLDKLFWAFETLDFHEPEKETGILKMLMESLTSNIILEGKPSQLKYKYFLIHRYTL